MEPKHYENSLHYTKLTDETTASTILPMKEKKSSIALQPGTKVKAIQYNQSHGELSAPKGIVYQ